MQKRRLAGLDKSQVPPFYLYRSSEASLMHLRVSRNAFGSTFPVPFLTFLCIMLLSLTSGAQEKPTPKAPARHKSVLRPTMTSANTGAGKDPVEAHYRAAETCQLAGDLTAAEVE